MCKYVYNPVFIIKEMDYIYIYNSCDNYTVPMYNIIQKIYIHIYVNVRVV